MTSEISVAAPAGNNRCRRTPPLPSRPWVPTLYTAEGLPFVMVNVVSVFMYKSLGLSDSKIAFFTSLVAVPWMIKPLWGALIEMFRTKKTFVLATEFGGGISFGLVALSLHLPFWFAGTLIFFGLCAINSSVHDTAADGIYVTVLNAKQQAKWVGWQGAFYNVGKIVSQGGFVLAAGILEKSYGPVMAWTMVFCAFGLLMITIGLWHLLFLPSGGRAKPVSAARPPAHSSTCW